MSEHLSLQDLRNYDPRLREGSTRWRACCPFCGDGYPRDIAHQSLAAGKDTGAWRCWRCQKTGKLTDFWTERKHEAQQPLRPLAALPEDQDPAPDQRLMEHYARMVQRFPGSPGAQYLATRGITEQVARDCGCGYAGSWKHYEKRDEKWVQVGVSRRVVFPVWNRRQELIALQGRVVADGEYGPGKQSRGPISAGVFLTPGALDGGRVIVVEAPIDAMTLYQCGYPAAATLGTAFPLWLARHAAGRAVYTGHDHDPVNANTGTRPGDEAAARAAELLELAGSVAVRLRPPVEGQDWNQWLQADPDGLGAFLAAALG